jgi:hypothetical protein
MVVNCRQHRKSLQLIKLQIKLRKGITDDREKEEVEKRIRALERELRLN